MSLFLVQNRIKSTHLNNSKKRKICRRNAVLRYQFKIYVKSRIKIGISGQHYFEKIEK